MSILEKAGDYEILQFSSRSALQNLLNLKMMCMIEVLLRHERRRNIMTRELSYTQIGDYLYPNLYLPETEEDTPMGKYGMLHKTYLKKHKPMLYDRMLLVGKLDGYLMDIDRRATELVDQLTQQLAQQNGVDEEMKADNQMAWVQAMNNFKASAEEVVLQQLVYR